jgi:hypothetical protein
MLDILGPQTRLCDGLSRRRFLSLGSLGAFGLTLPQLFAADARADDAPARSCILLWLQGGPSQIDTFDPKPDAPAEIRGPFGPLETNVAGIRIADVFPRLARHADKYALLRSVHAPAALHIMGHQYMLAGAGSNTIAYPNMAAVVARLRGGESLLPPWVMLPNVAYETNATPERLCQTAGYLGNEFNPVIPQGDLVEGPLSLRELDPPAFVSGPRQARRRALLEAGRAPLGNVEPGRVVDALYQKAYGLMDGAGVRRALDVRHEPDALRDRYGRNHVGQGALVARRLVEAGVRFVTLNWPNRLAWDVHTDLEGQMRTHLCPTLDRALSTLLDDLHQRGLLQSTLVVAMGEMGRTPKLGNSDFRYADGRDHWSGAMSVLMAGGGVRGGRVVGASDEQGAYPADRPIPCEDLVATVYHAFGISPDDRIVTREEVPKPVLEHGRPVRELF